MHTFVVLMVRSIPFATTSQARSARHASGNITQWRKSSRTFFGAVLAGLICFIIAFEDRPFQALAPGKTRRGSSDMMAGCRHYKHAARSSLVEEGKIFHRLTGTYLMRLHWRSWMNSSN